MNIHVGLSYGAFPAKVAASIKCSLEEAEAIFNAYHNEMYPLITEFREEVIARAKEQGYVHLGLGCRIYSSDIDGEARTLFNACSQFWSILTLLTIEKLYSEIDKAGYSNDIFITSTIYDAIYFIVRKDAKAIKWLNDTLIPIMEKDFLENQIVHNEANLEIGNSWAKVFELKHNISEEEISDIIKGEL